MKVFLTNEAISEFTRNNPQLLKIKKLKKVIVYDNNIVATCKTDDGEKVSLGLGWLKDENGNILKSIEDLSSEVKVKKYKHESKNIRGLYYFS